MPANEPNNADPYDRMKNLNIRFNPNQTPGGIYEPAVLFGNSLCYVSGHNCKLDGLLRHKGRVGREVTVDEARDDARQCIVNILTSLHNALGDLGRVKKIVKILAFVASDDSFHEQPKVLDAASQMLIDVFGETIGKAARSAVGVNVLPNNQPVEIEMLVELTPDPQRKTA